MPVATPAGDGKPPVCPPQGNVRRKIIKPQSSWRPVDFDELWRYRELFYFFIWRDIRVRYKQTVLGAGWAIIQPVMTMVVFSVFFGRFGGLSKNVDTPYPVFVYAGLLPWTFFSAAVSQAGLSVLNNAHLISKVYFPRLLTPASAVGALLLDFVISFAVLFVLLLFYGISLQAKLLAVPIFMLGTMVAAIGVGTMLAAMVVAYRDFRHLIPFLVQMWMFASPVAYPLEVIPERYRLIYSLNPMVGMISGFRSAILGQPWNWTAIGISSVVTLLMLVAGMYYFRNTERRFADII